MIKQAPIVIAILASAICAIATFAVVYPKYEVELARADAAEARVSKKDIIINEINSSLERLNKELDAERLLTVQTQSQLQDTSREFFYLGVYSGCFQATENAASRCADYTKSTIENGLFEFTLEQLQSSDLRQPSLPSTQK